MTNRLLLWLAAKYFVERRVSRQLRRQVADIQRQLATARDETRHARDETSGRDSTVVLLRAEIEALALWRERELERLRQETAIIVARRTRALQGQPEAEDDGL